MAWKDHPVVVAATVCVATIGVCYKLLVPVYTSSLENQVRKDAVEISELNRRLSEATLTVARLTRENRDLIAKSQLSFCNPYPAGLDNILIGDPLRKIEDVYSSGNYSFTKNKRWYSITLPNNPLFRTVAFYFNSDKVTHILYQFDIPIEDSANRRPIALAARDALVKQVSAAFPAAKIKEDNSDDEGGYDFMIGGKAALTVDLVGYEVRYDIRSTCEAAK